MINTTYFNQIASLLSDISSLKHDVDTIKNWINIFPDLTTYMKNIESQVSGLANNYNNILQTVVSQAQVVANLNKVQINQANIIKQLEQSLQNSQQAIEDSKKAISESQTTIKKLDDVVIPRIDQNVRNIELDILPKLETNIEDIKIAGEKASKSLEAANNTIEQVKSFVAKLQDSFQAMIEYWQYFNDRNTRYSEVIQIRADEIGKDQQDIMGQLNELIGCGNKDDPIARAGCRIDNLIDVAEDSGRSWKHTFELFKTMVEQIKFNVNEGKKLSYRLQAIGQGITLEQQKQVERQEELRRLEEEKRMAELEARKTEEERQYEKCAGLLLDAQEMTPGTEEYNTNTAIFNNECKQYKALSAEKRAEIEEKVRNCRYIKGQLDRYQWNYYTSSTFRHLRAAYKDECNKLYRCSEKNKLALYDYLDNMGVDRYGRAIHIDWRLAYYENTGEEFVMSAEQEKIIKEYLDNMSLSVYGTEARYLRIHGWELNTNKIYYLPAEKCSALKEYIDNMDPAQYGSTLYVRLEDERMRHCK